MKKLSVVFVLLAGILWGIIGIFVRRFQGFGISSLELALDRILFAAIIFAIFILIYNKSLFKIKIKDLWIFFGTGVISLATFSFCYFKAIEIMDLSVAAILLYTAPAFVMIFSIILFKEKVTISKIISLVLTFLGCMFVTGVLSGNVLITLEGFIFGILSGLCYGLYSIFTRVALNKGYNTFTIVLYTMIFGGIAILLVVRPVKTFELVKSKPTEIIWVLAFVLFSEILPYFLYTFGLKYLKNTTASIIVSVEPVVATILGALAFNEMIQVPFGYIGIVLVIISILLANMSDYFLEKKKGKI